MSECFATGLTQPLTTEPDCATILATQFPNLEFRDYSFTPPQYQVPYYRSVVYDKVVGPQSLIGDSVTYFVSVQHARNIAAKDVLAKLESRQAPGNPSVQGWVYYPYMCRMLPLSTAIDYCIRHIDLM